MLRLRLLSLIAAAALCASESVVTTVFAGAACASSGAASPLLTVAETSVCESVNAPGTVSFTQSTGGCSGCLSATSCGGGVGCSSFSCGCVVDTPASTTSQMHRCFNTTHQQLWTWPAAGCTGTPSALLPPVALASSSCTVLPSGAFSQLAVCSQAGYHLQGNRTAILSTASASLPLSAAAACPLTSATSITALDMFAPAGACVPYRTAAGVLSSASFSCGGTVAVTVDVASEFCSAALATTRVLTLPAGDGRACAAYSAPRQANAVQCATANDNAVATVVCPAGSIISAVDFASYGTPSTAGACGTYTLGACHAPTAPALAQDRCVGQSSCALTSSTGVYGDPCPGTSKRYGIQVQCTPALYVSASCASAYAPTASADYLQTTVYTGQYCTAYYLAGGGGATASPSPTAAPTPTSMSPLLTSVWSFGCSRWSYTVGAALWHGSQRYRCYNATHLQLYSWRGAPGAPSGPGASCGGAHSNVTAPLQAAPMAGQSSVTVAAAGALPCLNMTGAAGAQFSYTSMCVASGVYSVRSAESVTIYEFAQRNPPPASAVGPGSSCTSNSPEAAPGNTYTLDFLTPRQACYPMPRTRAMSAAYVPPALTSVSYSCAQGALALFIDNSSSTCSAAAAQQLSSPIGGSTRACFLSPAGADQQVAGVFGTAWAITNATQAQYVSSTCPMPSLTASVSASVMRTASQSPMPSPSTSPSPSVSATRSSSATRSRSATASTSAAASPSAAPSLLGPSRVTLRVALLLYQSPAAAAAHSDWNASLLQPLALLSLRAGMLCIAGPSAVLSATTVIALGGSAVAPGMAGNAGDSAAGGCSSLTGGAVNAAASGLAPAGFSKRRVVIDVGIAVPPATSARRLLLGEGAGAALAAAASHGGGRILLLAASVLGNRAVSAAILALATMTNASSALAGAGTPFTSQLGAVMASIGASAASVVSVTVFGENGTSYDLTPADIGALASTAAAAPTPAAAAATVPIGGVAAGVAVAVIGIAAVSTLLVLRQRRQARGMARLASSRILADLPAAAAVHDAATPQKINPLLAAGAHAATAGKWPSTRPQHTPSSIAPHGASDDSGTAGAAVAAALAVSDLDASDAPPGWKQRYSHTKQAVYWANEATGVSTWTRPASGGEWPVDAMQQEEAQVQPAGAAEAALPEGWTQAWSTNKQASYYKHAARGVSTWERPVTFSLTDA